LEPDISGETDRLENIPSSTTKIKMFENLDYETWYNNWHPRCPTNLFWFFLE